MLDGCSNGKLPSCFAAHDNHDYRQGIQCSSVHKVLLDTSFHLIISNFLFVALANIIAIGLNLYISFSIFTLWYGLEA